MTGPETSGPGTAGTALAVDIGVFAHDEGATIGALVAELGRQALLLDPAADARVLILANGCTDDTVARAEAAVAALALPARDRIRVIELAQGGKSRTVHRFIHALSRPEAQVLGFMDADILLPRADTLARMVAALAERPGLRVFTSRPVKDVTHFGLKVGAVAGLIAAGGDGLTDWRKSICGQLFVMRAGAARRIGLPAGLPVEDGFLRAMVLTDLLSAPQDLSRIDGDPEVFHVYESIRGLGELIRHQTRIVVGSAVNAALFGRIRREAPDEPAAHRLLMAAAADEAWLGRVLREELPRAPHGYVPFDFLTKRLRRSGGARGLRGMAVLAAGFGLDALVWLRAQIRMALRPSAGFW
jgi:hypothetical protein